MSTISAADPHTRSADLAPARKPARTAPPVTAPTEAEVTAAFRAEPHAFLDVGHSRLAYWRFGRGPDVLFVHGWPLHAATFRKLVPLLAGSNTCHLVDLPGTGQTESDDDAPIDLVSHAATVRRAVDALGLSRYAIVAHDSGGFIARLLAAEDRRVVALVMGNTEIPGHTPWLVALLAALVKHGSVGLLLRSMRSRAVRRSPLGFGGCFSDLDLLDGEFHELFVEPLLSSPKVARGQMRLAATLDVLATENLADVHARISCPSLLIWGAEDPFFPLRKARRMLPQLAGGAELFAIAGAKLFVHEEHPRAFANHAAPFLRAALGE